ncbi:unnamed protein product [Cuscuta europaea]|uniref:Remorin N-terminal domain-containing protein n=1 Tax=Cuscuta europaea TaxID=41803 RepID=A0A9P0ZEZ5_CUSEU|nr:unnamed protein product [Cuscuta europaea]
MATAAEPAVVEKPAAVPPPPAAVMKPEEPPLASATTHNMGPVKEVVPPVLPEKPVAAAHKNPDHPQLSTAPKPSLDRDIALAKIEDEKRTSFIKAWEESEKSKVENKAGPKSSLLKCCPGKTPKKQVLKQN